MINPNTFITIKGKYSETNNGVWVECEVTIPIKNIRNLDKSGNPNKGGVSGNFIRILMEYQSLAPKIIAILVDEKTTDWVKSILADTDFGAPLIDTTEQIRVLVKEEVRKVKKTAIEDLGEI